MATIISHNIISPLGLSSNDNFKALLEGVSSIASYQGVHEGMRPYSASLFTAEANKELAIEGYSRYEALSIQSIKKALEGVDFDLSSSETCLILSTTKGNIEQLEKDCSINISPASAAQRIADFFEIKTTPITVCNACISGVSAMLLAQRLVDAGVYKNIVVCGCDVQCEFIISGFQSLNAVSPNPCCPFDIERIGLSLGEAVATVIVSQSHASAGWKIIKGCVRNDAYHNTTPSPVGEGCCMALSQLALKNNDDIAFINAHGTATMFNDQMESKAIESADLSHLPVNALKGYFGHTMGAAGIIESIISMEALDAGVILGTKGFSIKGVSGKVNVITQPVKTNKKSFVKIISGFGGCNGALLMSKETHNNDQSKLSEYKKISTIKIVNNRVLINGAELEVANEGKALLKELYTKYIGNYPKFHKMDLLCQLGFVAIQILLKDLESEAKRNLAIALFNSSSSIATDKEYIKTIADKDNYFPSPALFVYTLPNIVLSEVAIKEGINGETTMYLLPQKDEYVMTQVAKSTFADNDVKEMVVGWIDCFNESNFIAELSIIKKLE